MLDRLAERHAALLFMLVLTVATALKVLVLSGTDGGGELWQAYLPKTLMLVQGQDPYSTQVWMAPYPPLLFVLLGAVVKLATWGSGPGPGQVILAGWGIRIAALLADLLIGIFIFLALRARRVHGLWSLFPPALYLLLLPSVSFHNYYWFNGDIFGYLILAGSLLAYVKEHVLIGTVLLSLEVIYKIHPILSLPLVLVWMMRRQGFLRALPGLVSSLAILLVGLVLPISMPDYLNAIVGFNLSNGSGSGTVSFTLMNLFKGVLPTYFGVTLSSLTVNEIWVATTLALFTIALGVVWSSSGRLDPVDVVLLGLLAWLIPLRTLYSFYLVWGFVPFFFKGSVVRLIVLGGVFEAASNLQAWSWNVPPNPFPWMDSVYGFFITSLSFAAWSIIGLLLVLRQIRIRGFSPLVASQKILT